jgi:GDP-mannose 6-dehydrogenase
MKISIFGLGYVGAVSLACLARDGHSVVGVDIDPAKLEMIRAGRSPLVEEGMLELMAQAAASGRIGVTDDARAAIHATELSFVCVGTPSSANGSQDQSAVLRITRDIGRALRDKREAHTVVFRSTVVPGTVEETLRHILRQESGKREGVGFHLGFQPEFLREGTAIRDYDNPPFTIVGTDSAVVVEELRALFGHLPAEFHAISIRAAETVKYSCNNFHALKITFANETPRLCEALGVDAAEVMELMCRDTRLNISRAYLRPGFAFGGSCLPKDLRATAYLAKMRDVELPMLAGVLASNRLHLEHAVDKILASRRRCIGLVGLSFKQGTDDLRESPLVRLAEECLGKGLQLLVYDPDVHLSRLLGANRAFVQATIPHLDALIRGQIEEVIEPSELLVVARNDAATAEALARLARPDQMILDLVRLPNRDALQAQYRGLCW